MIRGLAIDTGAAVVMSLHPSLTGMNTGTGLSGNTAWYNSVRAQVYLTKPEPKDEETPDQDLRDLSAKKNQHGPLSKPKRLRWKNGVFVVERDERTSLQKVAAEQKADRAFLALLAKFTQQKRKACVATGTSYAPAVFAKEADAEGVDKSELERAMRRLLDAGAIVNEEFGPPSRRRFQLRLKSDLAGTESDS